MSEPRKAPDYITPERAGAFLIESTARAYPHRPPYPQALIDALRTLLPDGGGSVLELGCGTGEVSRRLAPHVKRVDAIDPSAAMIEVGRGEEGGGAANLAWTNVAAEEFETDRRYDLVVTALSLHWMNWYTVLPKIAGLLKRGGAYALVTNRTIRSVPWAAAIEELVPRYSAIPNWTPIDLVAEVRASEVFDLGEVQKVGPEHFEQSVENYLESWHSRAGFVRERLAEGAEDKFRAGIAAAVQPHAREDSEGRRWIGIDVRAEFVIGRPRVS